MLLQNVSFFEVGLFCLGLTWVGTLIFIPSWVHLWRLCLLGAGWGNLVCWVVTCFLGILYCFNGDFMYYYR